MGGGGSYRQATCQLHSNQHWQFTVFWHCQNTHRASLVSLAYLLKSIHWPLTDELFHHSNWGILHDENKAHLIDNTYWTRSSRVHANIGLGELKHSELFTQLRSLELDVFAFLLDYVKLIYKLTECPSIPQEKKNMKLKEIIKRIIKIIEHNLQSYKLNHYY